MIASKPELVSIVIRCYNQEAYLPEAFESAWNQTYPNLEVVLINDGSRDKTSLLLRSYAQRVREGRAVQIIDNTENHGARWAFNRGVRATHGAYYAVLDADDALDPAYIEKTAVILRDHPEIGFVYTDMQQFGKKSDVYVSQSFDRATLLDHNYVNQGALTRKSVFDLVGGIQETRALVWEDWDFWLGCLEHDIVGSYIPLPLYRYRIHSKNRNDKSFFQIFLLTWKFWSMHPALFPLSLRFKLLARKIKRNATTPHTP